MKVATVPSSSSSRKTYVALGICSFTGLIDNDDCSGYILIFDITTLSSSDQHLHPYKEIDTKAPVMQMDLMHTEDKYFLVVGKKSHFVSTSSSAVSLFDFQQFKESEQFTLTNYIACMVVVKNGILVGDINYGMTFLQYKVSEFQKYT